MAIYLDKTARLAQMQQEAESNRGKMNLLSDDDPRAVKITEHIRDDYTLTEEVGILRKTIAKLLTVINTNGIDISEFTEYNTKVEQAKNEAKAEMQNQVNSINNQ